MTNGETLVRGAEQRGVLVVGVMGFRNEGDFSLAVSAAFREWMREEPGRAEKVAEVVEVVEWLRGGAPHEVGELVWGAGEGE